MAYGCSHEPVIHDVTPSALGCEECLKIGSPWVHLRLCRACGHVGCCDDSPNRNATGIFTRHAIPLSKATIRRKAGDGAISTRSCWIWQTAPPHITVQFRATIEPAQQPPLRAGSHRDAERQQKRPSPDINATLFRSMVLLLFVIHVLIALAL